MDSINFQIPSLERIIALRNAIAKNSANGNPPCAFIRLISSDEVKWIIQEMKWSGEVESLNPIDFRKINLSGVNISKMRLNGANFAEANLNSTTFFQSELSGSSFISSSIINADFSESICEWADFTSANLININFRRAKLSGVILKDAIMVNANLNSAHLENADLSRASLANAVLDGAILMNANLQKSLLSQASLIGSSLNGANLSEVTAEETDFTNAFLSSIHAQQASFTNAIFNGAILINAYLHLAILRSSDLRGAKLNNADLRGADLREGRFDDSTQLTDIQLNSHTKVGDIIWNNVPLIRVNWTQIKKLGDEDEITVKRKESTYSIWKNRRNSARIKLATQRDALVSAYRSAARANHGLFLTLRNQGISQEASHYRLREKQLNRIALRIERKYIQWAGSLIIDATSGYGEKPGRIFGSYLWVVGIFTVLYYLIAQSEQTKLSKLSWDEALVLSLTSFHGRGFFPGFLMLGDWITRVASIEAVIGLFIELVLISTFNRRILDS